MQEREHGEAAGGTDSGRRAGLPSSSHRSAARAGASRNPARVLELLSSPAAAAETRLPGTEMNPSFFVSKFGVWMAQDGWGLGCGAKRSIWIMGL